MSVPGRVFIYGGRGALGAACVQHFKSQNWWVGSIDMKENDIADANILVRPDDSWQQQADFVENKVKELLKGQKADAFICVAGGWAGGNAGSADLIKNSEMMLKQSIWTSVISASVAAAHLKEGGLLTLPGAKPALGGTPGMVGYGLAKAAVHQLTQSLAGDGSGLPSNSLVVAILPQTLDTPMNRKWMPNADTSTWTPLDFVAKMFYRWSQGEERPKNGSLVSLITKNHVTELTFN